MGYSKIKDSLPKKECLSNESVNSNEKDFGIKGFDKYYTEEVGITYIKPISYFNSQGTILALSRKS